MRNRTTPPRFTPVPKATLFSTRQRSSGRRASPPLPATCRRLRTTAARTDQTPACSGSRAMSSSDSAHDRTNHTDTEDTEKRNTENSEKRSGKKSPSCLLFFSVVVLSVSSVRLWLVFFGDCVMGVNAPLNRKLRMGLIGGGQGAFIGKVHSIAGIMDNRAHLIAGALSSDPAKAKASAPDYDIKPERAYGSYQEMAAAEAKLPANERIDFVSIATPNHMHFN